MQLLGGGTILREVEAAAVILENDYQVAADIWSLTSVNELQREGKAAQRWNMLHPGRTPRALCYALAGETGPCSGGHRLHEILCGPDSGVRPGQLYCAGHRRLRPLGYAQKLREFFEVSREYIVMAALKALADEGRLRLPVSMRRCARWVSSRTRTTP